MLHGYVTSDLGDVDRREMASTYVDGGSMHQLVIVDDKFKASTALMAY